jgi:hypothetical protein
VVQGHGVPAGCRAMGARLKRGVRPHSDAVRWLTWLIILVAIAGTYGCTEHGILTRHGSWEIEYSGKWSREAHRRLSKYSLYHVQGTQRTFVADHIRGYDFYPDDCIVFHATGPGPGGYFAACGNRRPLRVSGPDDGWRKLGDSFQQVEVRAGEVVVVRRRDIAEILLQAKIQPSLPETGR